MTSCSYKVLQIHANASKHLLCGCSMALRSPIPTHRFLDTDKSGYLTRSELKDGFSILGVQLADNVADEVMDVSGLMR